MEECLFENEHITGVQDLEVSQIKDVLHIKFTLVNALPFIMAERRILWIWLQMQILTSSTDLLR